MTMGQLPAQAERFSRYLRELTALLDTGAGWCGVFWQRDPDGMRACLEGTELPPWDVLEALLQDLAARHGTAAAERETVRARELHAEAATAYDLRPGGREALAERLGAMRSEQRYAAERERELAIRLRAAAGGSEWQGLDVELAWARDDHERASARCAELGGRLAALDALPAPRGRAPAPDSWFRAEPAEAAEAWPSVSWEAQRSADRFFPHTVPSRNRGAAPDPGPQTPDGLEGAARHEGLPRGADPGQPYQARPAIEDTPEGRPGGWGLAPARGGAAHVTAGEGRGGEEIRQASPGRRADGVAPAPPEGRAADRPAPKRRPRGARYAGLDVDDGDGDGDDGSGAFAAAVPAPAMPAPPAQAAAPRGARYAGVEEEAPPPAVADPADAAQDRRAVADAVAVLVQLRAQGRTGEAHVLLCEAAGWPAARLPALAGALHRAGLGADWATLLWEAASLPPARLVALAATLDRAGLGEDGRQLLRQGVVRPAPEIATALLALDDEGGHIRELRALVDAFVRVRTPEDVAHVARTDPRRLSPLLLDAARKVSQSRYRDVVHALRVAGAAP